MSRIWGQIKYEIVLLLTFLGYFFLRVPRSGMLNPWVATNYLVTYENGFVSRGLIGTMLRPFLPHANSHNLYWLFVALTVCLTVMAAFLLGRVVRRANDVRTFILAMFFCVSPGSISYLYKFWNFGRYDLFLIAIAVLCLVLLAQDGERWLIAIPFLCSAAMLINQAFLLMFAPSIAAVMVFRQAGSARKPVARIGLTLTLASLGFSAMALHWWGRPDPVALADTVNAMRARSGFELSQMMLTMEYTFSLRDHLAFTAHNLLPRLVNLGAALLLVSPVAGFFVCSWRSILGQHGRERRLLWLLALSTLGVLPLFAVGVDYGRWISTVLLNNYLLIFFLVYKGYYKLESGTSFFAARRAWPLVLLLFVFYGFIGPLNDVATFDLLTPLFYISP